MAEKQQAWHKYAKINWGNIAEQAAGQFAGDLTKGVSGNIRDWFNKPKQQAQQQQPQMDPQMMMAYQQMMQQQQQRQQRPQPQQQATMAFNDFGKSSKYLLGLGFDKETLKQIIDAQ